MYRCGDYMSNEERRGNSTVGTEYGRLMDEYRSKGYSEVGATRMTQRECDKRGIPYRR